MSYTADQTRLLKQDPIVYRLRMLRSIITQADQYGAPRPSKRTVNFALAWERLETRVSTLAASDCITTQDEHDLLDYFRAIRQLSLQLNADDSAAADRQEKSSDDSDHSDSDRSAANQQDAETVSSQAADATSQSKAYQDGYADGLAWDLDGFTAITEIATETSGWHVGTIRRVGRDNCAEMWGVATIGSIAWEQACADYDRGCHAGVTAPQTERSGLPPCPKEALDDEAEVEGEEHEEHGHDCR